MYIPLEERETIITFNEKEPTASVYTMNGALIRKLDSLTQSRPDDARRVKTYPGRGAGIRGAQEVGEGQRRSDSDPGRARTQERTRTCQQIRPTCQEWRVNLPASRL